MSNFSIGDADTTPPEKEQKKEVKELTVLNKDSKESIYYTIFTEVEKGGKKQDE